MLHSEVRKLVFKTADLAEKVQVRAYYPEELRAVHAAFWYIFSENNQDDLIRIFNKTEYE